MKTSYLKMAADGLEQIKSQANEIGPDAHAIVLLARHAGQCIEIAAGQIDQLRLDVSSGFENDVESPHPERT